MMFLSNLKLYAIVALLVVIIGLGSWLGVLYAMNNAKKNEIVQLHKKVQTLEDSLRSSENRLEDLKKIHARRQRMYHHYIRNLGNIDKLSPDQIQKALNNEKID